MKGFTCAAIASAILAVSSVQGMPDFLKQLPNGDKFTKQLGHTGETSYTAFGTAFLSAGTTWKKEFCEQTFPGSKITNGQAFGDPCCVWEAGKPAPQSVTAFTTNPGAGTTCATAGGGGNGGGNGGNGGGNGGGNNKPPSPAPAPAGNNNKPATGGGNNKPATGGGNNKPATGGGNNKPATGGGNNNKAPGKACKKKKRVL